MKHLWKITNRFYSEDSRTAAFLCMNILLFTLLPMGCGIIFCILTQKSPIIEYLPDMMLVSIYSGIIFGLFGGIFFIMRGAGE